jgi:hypothetical protein
MVTDVKPAQLPKFLLLMVFAQTAQKVKLPKTEDPAILLKLPAKPTRRESALPSVNHAQIIPEYHQMVCNASDAHKVKLLPNLVSARCAHQDMVPLMELTASNLELLVVIDKEESALLNARPAHHTH